MPADIITVVVVVGNMSVLMDKINQAAYAGIRVTDVYEKHDPAELAALLQTGHVRAHNGYVYSTMFMRFLDSGTRGRFAQ